MKIGFLVDKINFGGGEKILKMLIDALYKAGHTIYIYSWNKDWLTVECPKGFCIYILEGSGPIGIKGKIEAFYKLKIKLSDTRPDCLVVFSLGLAEIAVWSAKVAKVPTLLSERVDPRFLPQSMIHRLLKKIVYEVCDGIVFQTENVQTYFSKRIQKKSVVIPNPIMYDTLPSPEIENAGKTIVAIGRLSSEKNFDMLIKAFYAIGNNDYIIKIYGDGPLFSHFEQLCSSLGISDRVILKGNVGDIINEIRCADIFVMTSNHEGMPNALIEAMSMGLACISTDFPSGGARKLIKNGVNGILIPVNDCQALQNALLKIIEDDEYKLRLKKSAMKIRETNSKTQIIPLWINYLHHLVNL
ncbi:glycosyltransferase [uncultured Alistipes sp.]|uniref:glycosyltransferase n=1 Tax=uncultured Alistipes sp. TaxID=538949 RepID=UPI0026668B73|nr:glycosyltransferase [uncultured Alistipes sp.]